MLARREQPSGPLAFFGADVDRLFSRLWGSPLGLPEGAGNSGFVPALNVWEDKEGVYAEVDVPGMKLEDLELDVVDQTLTITGQRKDGRAEKEGDSYLHREIGYGTFRRAVRVPSKIDGAKAEAALSDGVLKVTLPKLEALRARKIEVKATK